MQNRFITFDNNDDIKDSMLKYLDDILLQHGCSDIKMPVYTCLNELLINAIKANYKNLYFEEYSPQNNALEIIPYHKALKLFKLEMSTQRIDYLFQLAKEKDIKVIIDISVDDNKNLEMKVTNPAEMTLVEKENIEKKIELAKKYKTLSDYFIVSENDPNKEGGGLGIIFIIMMLKSFGLSEDHFSIHSEDNTTASRITIPLTKEVVSMYRQNIKENEDRD